MGYTNKTSHYDLPQWIAGDKPSWLGDMNTAMLNIDTAIAGADASATAAESSAAAANAQVQAQEAKITKNTTDIQALTGELADVSGVANAALPKNGGTMTGALTLAGDPTQDLQAATKKYVDENGAGEVVNFVKYTDNLRFTDKSKFRFNNAVMALVFSGGVMHTSFSGTITLGAGVFVPIESVAGNPLGLNATTPTSDSDLTELVGNYAIKKSGANVSFKCYAYYDGTSTYIGFAGLSDNLSTLQGANVDGMIVEVL